MTYIENVKNGENQSINRQINAEILTVVASAIRDVVSEDWIGEMNIDGSTSFNDDLEMESIEIVALAEKLQHAYGETVDFVEWISTKTLDDLVAMTVGDLVVFIRSKID